MARRGMAVASLLLAVLAATDAPGASAIEGLQLPVLSQSDGLYHWHTTTGCGVLRGAIAQPKPYRIEWTGGCSQQWIDGPGRLRYYSELGLEYEQTDAVYRQGTLQSGTWTYFHDPDATAGLGLWRVVIAAGVQQSAHPVARNQAGAEFQATYDRKLARFGSAATGGPRRPRAAPYTGDRLPVRDPSDGYEYWTAADGCTIQRIDYEVTRPLRPAHIEWRGNCDSGWPEGKGEVRWSRAGVVIAETSGYFVAGKLRDGRMEWVAAPVDDSEPAYVQVTEYRDFKAVSRETRKGRRVPAALAQAIRQERAEFRERHPKAKFEWFTAEEKQAMGKFFGDVVDATLAVSEQKAAQARLDRATANYDAAIAASRPEQANLQEKMDAEMSLNAVKARNANAGRFAALNASIRDSKRTPGTEAPRADSCFSRIDGGLDRSEREGLGADERERGRYMNQCRDVTIASFLCIYERKGTTNPGVCPSGPRRYMKFGDIWRENFDPSNDSNGTFGAEVFCPKGSHPIEFEAFDDTREHGGGNWKCVWN